MTERQDAIGYKTVLERLKRVADECGRPRAFAILKHHGADSLRDLPPRAWPRVIYQCEFALLAAKVWDALWVESNARDLVWARSAERNHTQNFRNAVDAWFDSCDQELRIASPELYNDRGEPLN